MRFSCCIFSFPACDFRKTMAYYRETIHPINFVERTIIMVRVACCWDDGMETDLRLIELLKKYHAKATFNLNPGLYYPDRRRTSGWQFPDNPHFINRTFSRKELPEVYRGFRIASHGYFHADLRKVTTEEYVYDATEARKALEDLFQMEIPGFVYGGGFCSEEAARALADAGFVYGRTVENTDHVLQISNPLLLKSSAHFRHGDFLDRFDAAKRENGVFYFWGHSCEMQDREAEWEMFEQRLARIANDPETRWIDVVDIVRPS